MIIPLEGKRMERSHKINCPSLGFHANLDMRETSSVGWTHSCILGKGERTAQNKLPQFRVLRGSKLVDGLKMARLHKPYQMLVTNVDILNEIFLDTP